MTKAIKEVMTPNPATLQATATIAEAAQVMRDKNIGDVIVLNDATMCGIVTDRDIVIRGIASGKDSKSSLGDICSGDVITVDADDNIGAAIQIMEQKALRRLPVVEGGKPVGIVSLGDLAIERDGKSALAHISEAPANK